jgi:hypothetical protein
VLYPLLLGCVLTVVAAKGVIMFDWTAALIVAFVQRVYFGANVSGGP